MIIASLDDDDNQLDLYIYCRLNNRLKYDFIVPQSSTSYTTYLLANQERWSHVENPGYEYLGESPRGIYRIASIKLLLILKRYMLYYPH